MQKLHSCLCWEDGRSKPIRMIEEPTEQQAAIMGVFGYEMSGEESYRKSRFNMRYLHDFLLLSPL